MVEPDIAALVGSIDQSDEHIDRQNSTCLICLTKEADCVIVQCGHCFLCMECWNEWDKQDAEWFGLLDPSEDIIENVLQPTTSHAEKCPMCRAPVEKVVRLFRP